MKKLLRSTFLLVFLLLMAAPAFADTYPYLTFQDSADFTVVKPRFSNESITARGLDASYQKQTISNPQNITWTSSNSSVAYIYPTTGATVTVYTIGLGEATITASYTCDDNTVITCPANVMVDRLINPVNIVQDVDITIVGDPNGSGIDIDLSDVDVPRFSLKNVFGSSFDDDDVLKMDPTAMHALLYALELELDDDNYVWGDANWDWDWVPSNVTLDYEGSYVAVIDGDVSGWPTGWKLKVDGEELDIASSIVKINATEPLDWAFTDDWN